MFVMYSEMITRFFEQEHDSDSAQYILECYADVFDYYCSKSRFCDEQDIIECADFINQYNNGER